MTDDTSLPSEHAVKKYLEKHPRFFADKEELLVAMKVPHASGNAVSLVEKQLSILRERNSELRNRIGGLIDNARTNDRLFSHSRKLILSLLDSKDIAQAVDCVHGSFTQDFGIETTQIILFDSHTISRARNERRASAEEKIGRYLKARQTVSGCLSQEELRFIFAEKSNKVGSAALSILAYGDLFGVLAIGNEDPQFYQSNMDTLFLSYIAEVFSRKLRDLI